MTHPAVRGAGGLLALFSSVALLLAGGAFAQDTLPAQADSDHPDAGQRYRVTVTNLTRGQQFTPILVATHREGVRLFAEGRPASLGLQILAEEGDTAPLTAELLATPGVFDVVTAPPPPLLNPGASRIAIVRTRGRFDHVSVAAMLIPTNDAFFAVNGVRGPRGRSSLVLRSVAYDAGSERNDELCASIPGPSFAECGGPGGGGKPSGDEEGFVHIHAGIHGIGDLEAAKRDWRNPVAKIVIERIP